MEKRKETESMKFIKGISIVIFLFLFSCNTQNGKIESGQSEWQNIKVSENGHFFQYENGDPFFWLGDTGWLLFKKLNRPDAAKYLDIRKEQGFNVIQVMLLHETGVTDWQGTPALIDRDASKPNILPGNDPNDSLQYDYWDHVEYIVDLAAEKGLWMALVPVWGSPVSADEVSVEQADIYATFLAERFGSKPNIIWLNGGDVVGDKHMPVWDKIGETINNIDSTHLITFHPRGRKMSSEWFHDRDWLDFNMFQSGHRTYNQDTASDSHRFGPDNWKYVQREWSLKPTKPTLDGEPSYEEIPYGLHDPNLPYWVAADLRRYAYWSVFAGGAGFTYGHNSVMQFYRASDGDNKAFGAKSYWTDAMTYPGAEQMHHLKDLMLSVNYYSRIPAQNLILDQSEQYEYQTATQGKDYILVYTFTGRDITLKMGSLQGDSLNVQWFDPRTGDYLERGKVKNTDTQVFDAPGEPVEGNDWVLVLRQEK